MIYVMAVANAQAATLKQIPSCLTLSQCTVDVEFRRSDGYVTANSAEVTEMAKTRFTYIYLLDISRWVGKITIAVTERSH